MRLQGGGRLVRLAFRQFDLNYLEDRSDAATTARHLVDKCVVPFSERQESGCQINVHLLGHSTGAYVISEAFAQAEKNGDLFKSKWRVDQIGFVAGDVSAKTLTDLEQWSRPMFDRCVRLTNYFNGYDYVLAVSNAKRFGTNPRATGWGRRLKLATRRWQT